MAFPSSDVSIPIGHEKKTTTTQRHRLGTRGISQDGERVFRYAQAGAVALLSAKLIQNAVAVGASSNATGLAVISASSGATTLQVVPQHASTANTYADGWIVSEVGANAGMYAISGITGSNTAKNSHDAFTSGAAATINLHPNDGLAAAFTSGTDTVGLRKNFYKDVIVAPATPTGVIVGATVAPMAIAAFGWIQTWGPAAVHMDTAPVAGESVAWLGGTTAGHAAGMTTLADNVDSPVIGWAITGGAGADAVNPIFLRIAS